MDLSEESLIHERRSVTIIQKTNSIVGVTNVFYWVVVPIILDFYQFGILSLTVLGIIIHNVDSIIPNHYKTHIILIWLITSILIIIVLIILTIIKSITKQSTRQVFDCCFSFVFDILICIIWAMMIAPNSYSVNYGFHSQYLSQKKEYHESIKSHSRYVDQLLKYCLNKGDKKQIHEKIVAANYYLLTMFDSKFSSKVQCQNKILLDKMQVLHKNGYKQDHIKLTDLKWKEMANNLKMNKWYDLHLKMLDLLWIFTLMQQIGIHICLCIIWTHGVWLLVGYMILQLINCKLRREYSQMQFYIRHILPNLSLYKLRANKIWNETWDSTQEMIENIETIRKMQFDQIHETNSVYASKLCNNSDVSSIIAQYLWYPLPNQESNMEQELQQFHTGLYYQLRPVSDTVIDFQ